MSAVIEEKASRVVEVLVSSVKATELMFGKIIGIALVAFTQFILWIVLTMALVGIAGKFIGQDMLSNLGDNPTEMVQGMNVGIHPDQLADAAGEGDLALIVSTLRNLPWGKIILVFFLFFFFGYMLYASLYAAIGSAVENEGDTQQLQIPPMAEVCMRPSFSVCRTISAARSGSICSESPRSTNVLIPFL